MQNVFRSRTLAKPKFLATSARENRSHVNNRKSPRRARFKSAARRREMLTRGTMRPGVAILAGRAAGRAKVRTAARAHGKCPIRRSDRHRTVPAATVDRAWFVPACSPGARQLAIEFAELLNDVLMFDPRV